MLHLLWNQLPLSLPKPHSGTSSSISCSPIPSPITSSFSDSPLCTSITPSLFYSRLKTYIFHKSYPLSFTSSQTASTDLCLHRFFWATRFLIFIFSLFFVSGPCARLSWPSRQLSSARKSTVSYRIVHPRNREFVIFTPSLEVIDFEYRQIRHKWYIAKTRFAGLNICRSKYPCQLSRLKHSQTKAFEIGIFWRGASLWTPITGRPGRRPQSIYGTLDRGMM